MGRATVLTTIAIYLATAALMAQPQAQAPRFEVASVRLIPESGQFPVPSQRLTDTRVDIQAGLNWILFWRFALSRNVGLYLRTSEPQDHEAHEEDPIAFFVLFVFFVVKDG
jgi:hypothetical protein